MKDVTSVTQPTKPSQNFTALTVAADPINIWLTYNGLM